MASQARSILSRGVPKTPFPSYQCRRNMAMEASTPPQIVTSIILNRSPTLTPDPTPFEVAYHSYQYKLTRALSNPFPQNFYFNKGSTLQQRYYVEEKAREKAAFGVGFGRGRSLRIPVEQGEKPQPRETEADRVGDVKSLDRKGSRNLYLLVKNSEDGGSWRFPQGPIQSGEALHQAAKRHLHEECGEDMDTWVVGRQPIGFAEKDKVFFFKAHIFAGQVTSETKDFAWLTKQEIQERVDPMYWESVQDMLSAY